MDEITLRNVPPDLLEGLEVEAARAGESVDETVVRLLRGSLPGHARREPAAETGLQQRTSPPVSAKRRDVAFLAGKWTNDEANAFDRELRWQRRIDPEDWK